jgi:hypothetical protein
MTRHNRIVPERVQRTDDRPPDVCLLTARATVLAAALGDSRRIGEEVLLRCAHALHHALQLMQMNAERERKEIKINMWTRRGGIWLRASWDLHPIFCSRYGSLHHDITLFYFIIEMSLKLPLWGNLRKYRKIFLNTLKNILILLPSQCKIILQKIN